MNSDVEPGREGTAESSGDPPKVRPTGESRDRPPVGPATDRTASRSGRWQWNRGEKLALFGVLVALVGLPFVIRGPLGGEETPGGGEGATDPSATVPCPGEGQDSRCVKLLEVPSDATARDDGFFALRSSGDFRLPEAPAGSVGLCWAVRGTDASNMTFDIRQARDAIGDPRVYTALRDGLCTAADDRSPLYVAEPEGTDGRPFTVVVFARLGAPNDDAPSD